MTQPKNITIHTDGSALGNPGPGGYGTLLSYNGQDRELSGGFALTTNNRMEILAVIVGLEALKERSRVTLYSDSRYVVDAITKGWAKRWKANGWKRNKQGERALNPDLWDKLLPLLDNHDIDFQWVRGHSGNPGNERVDRLAVAAASGKNLPPDTGYKP